MSRVFTKLLLLNLIWAFTGILGELIELPAVELVIFRTLIAVSVLRVLWRVRNLAGAPSGWHAARYFGTGFVVGAHWISFFLAVKWANVSVCLVALSTTALLTSFLQPLLERGRGVRWSEVGFGLVVVAAIAIILGFERNYAAGFAVGLVSAFFASIFNLLNSRFTGEADHRVIVTYEMAGACVLAVLCLPLSARFLSEGVGIDLMPSGQDWWWLLLLATVCTVYAFASYVKLLKEISAFGMALFANLEPLFGIVLAAAIFHDHTELGGAFYLGALMILGAVVSYLFFEHSRQKKTPGRGCE